MNTYYLDQLLLNAGNEFGLGTVYPGYYDTAWLARIPAKDDLTMPAYPQALNWLLERQNSDGTWRQASIRHFYSDLLNTLAVILALKAWPKLNYQVSIQNGLKGIESILNEPHTAVYETIGFEMLLPSLIAELQSANIELPKKLLQLNKEFHAKYLLKKNLIAEAEAISKHFKPQSWWFSIEMLGNPKKASSYSNHYKKMLSPKGSVAASPSATAYIVAALRYQGIEVPHAISYLETIIANPNSLNALSDVAPIDEFEMVFSANYLFEAGISKDHPLLQQLISQTRKYWLTRNAEGIGYSTHFFTDPDCSANAIMVLHHGGFDDISADILLKSFNGEYIETYTAERMGSVSSNIHVLQALQGFKLTEQLTTISNKLVTWLNNMAYTDKSQPAFAFSDKWHYSPIYPTSRAIFALMHLDPKIAQRCVDDLLNNQHADGGFGAFEFSTMEESAFAILALSSWHQHMHPIDLNVFSKAENYLNQHDIFAKDPLWIGKVLYCPRLVVASIITAAKHAVATCLASADNKFELKPIADNYENNALATHLFTHFQHWIQQCDLKPNKHLLSLDLPNACINALNTNDSTLLEIYTEYSLLVLTLDDILDETCINSISIKPILQAILTHLRDTKSTKLATTDIPQAFRSLLYAYKNIINRTKAINSDVAFFITSIENQFQALEQEFQNRKHNTLLSLNEYLNLRAIIGGMDTSAELAYALQNIQLPLSIRQSIEFDNLRYASYKATILLNDLFSYEKESQNAYVGDNFIFLYKFLNNVSLDEARQQCLLAYNKEIDTLLKLQNQPFQQAATILVRQVQANLNWVIRARRYAFYTA